MDPNFTITPPFFEIGPKAYLYGQAVVDLAIAADETSRKYQVDIIFTPQSVDIYRVVKAVKYLKVFAQHMDSLPVGRGIGSVLPEAVKGAGAVGVLLNHAEKPLPLDEIRRTIVRADEVGLATLVCAGCLEEVEAVARLNPNIVLAEAPELIGTGKREPSDLAVIETINQTVLRINPAIKVLHGAGISDENDVYQIIAHGAQATGSTSGIIKARDPFAMLDAMIQSVRQAWNTYH
ncbi:MAG: triose-phosphate isomerase [Anaerolineaceae bacterium]